MEKIPLDQYTISIDTTGEFIEKSIVLWADYLKETVRGLIYVVCYHYIPESIKNKYNRFKIHIALLSRLEWS